jgi:hypothetical protein
MIDDDVLREVRTAREEYCRKFDYDWDAIFRDLQEQQRTGGRVVVRLPLLRSASHNPEAVENRTEPGAPTTQAAASPGSPPLLSASHSSQE